MIIDVRLRSSMRVKSRFILAMLTALAMVGPTVCQAQVIIESDFSKGDFAALDWKPKGDWDVFRYPDEAKNNPGKLARFAANKPEGSLTKTFPSSRMKNYCSPRSCSPRTSETLCASSVLSLPVSIPSASFFPAPTKPYSSKKPAPRKFAPTPRTLWAYTSAAAPSSS